MKIYNHIDNSILKEITDALNNDKLIIFPTDTVYGLACNCFSDKAIKKIYNSKERNFNKPIAVLTDSISKVNLVVDKINPLEQKLIDKYFPGDLTIIFDKKKTVPNILTANKKTIGVRIPNNKIALEILKAYPYPLATTSVNIAGKKAGIRVDDFIEDFKDKVEIIIDGGNTSEIASTIVRIDNNKINILREGNIKITSD